MLFLVFYMLNFNNPNQIVSEVQSSPNFQVKDSIWVEYQIGTATWYGLGDGYNGKKTASGEIFDTYTLTAAHKKLKFGTIVKVTNLENDLSVIVRINDRGPFVKGRIIDLSYKAKQEIKMGGTSKVKLEILKTE